MPNTPTTRGQYPRPSGGDDDFPPDDIGALADRGALINAFDGQGLLVERSFMEGLGRGVYYWVTDLKTVIRYDGTNWFQVGSPPRVNGLPSSPFDGLEVDFIVDEANGVVWRLRYRAGATGTRKWEFVGGSAVRAASSAVKILTGSSQESAVLTIPAPLAGTYEVRWRATINENLNAEPVFANVVVTGASSTGNKIPAGGSIISSDSSWVTIPAGSIVMYARTEPFQPNTVQARFTDQRMYATPVAVG